MSLKVKRLIGWVLTGLVGLFMIGASGLPKFFDWPRKNEMMTKLELPPSLLPVIGVIGGTTPNGKVFEDVVPTFCLQKIEGRWHIMHQHLSKP